MKHNLFENFNLEWATFDCTLRFEQPAFFDEFIGGVLRSAIGYAIREVADPRTRRELWRPMTSNHKLKARGYSDNPRPFVLRVSDMGQTWYAEGGTLRFQFTLVGRAQNYLAYFIVALLRVGEHGLGLKRSRCTLQSIDSIGTKGERKRVYHESDKSYDDKFCRIQLASLPKTPPSPMITLTFQTPVHLKVFRRIVTPDTFTIEILLRRTIERIRSLGHLHNQRAWFDVDKSLWQMPFPIRSQSLHWQEWELWLGRRKQRFGGLVGQAMLEVDEDFPFYQALLAARWLNIGKKTTYGFGTVEVNPPSLKNGG